MAAETQRTDRVQQYYECADDHDAYERRWGYVNTSAGTYWRARDELLFAKVLEHFDTWNGSLRVLEVGVGHGHELAKLAQLGIAQSRMQGVDLMPGRLQRAGHLYPGLGLSQQDARRLAFAEGSFDLVMQFTCLMHAPDREAQRTMAAELARVLKPGGLLIWWDIAPVRWRVVLGRRASAVVQKFGLRRTGAALRDSLRELCSPARRKRVCAEADGTRDLPTAPADILALFPGFHGDALYAGVDYRIWEGAWKLSRSLANALWRRGWLSCHTFAALTKQTP